MKRVITVCALIAIIASICRYSLLRVESARNDVHAYTDSISSAIHDGDNAALIEHIDAFLEYWDSCETVLIKLVRHTDVDDITKSAARMRAYAAYLDYISIAAELSAIRNQIDHIWDSELVTFGNLW